MSTSIPNSKTGFATFPREIRDMIFLNIASAAGIYLNYHDNYYLQLKQHDSRSNDYIECIMMLHEWAPKSYIAKAACEVLWSYGTFHHGWYVDSEAIIDPRETLYVQTYKWEKTPLGTPIDLKECVRDLHLYTNPNPYSYAEPKDDDIQNLQIWIGQKRNAYSEGMIIVESISEACKELRARLGPGLKVLLCRATPYDLFKFRSIEDTDISWMWKPPSRMERDYVEQGIATVDQRIRVLIADGVGAEANYTLLEELLYAGEALPQEKDEVMAMESWEPWTGVSEEEFKDIKEHWGRDGL